jgi:TRAP-type C4-dicarboxylate transport system permease small subunit
LLREANMTENLGKSRAGRMVLWGGQVLGLLVAGGLGFMMFITFADVIGRYFLNAPVPAAFQLTEFAMGLVTFAALPILCAREQHVTIDLFAKLFRGRAERIRAAAINAFSTLVMAVIAWRLLLLGNRYAEMGDQTLLLAIPLAPFAYAMFGFSVIAVTALAVRTVVHIMDGENPASESVRI